MSVEDLVAALRRVLVATESAQTELDALDAVAGEGDYGVTMVLGWRAVSAALSETPPSGGAALRSAAEAFAGVGGPVGTLANCLVLSS